MPAESSGRRNATFRPHSRRKGTESGISLKGRGAIVRELAALIVDAIAPAVRPVVLIDGRSGSGKSTLASLLAPELGAELVRLDDLYPGWSGLEAASRMVVEDVLQRGRWTRWDWQLGMPAECHQLDTTRPLVVEGSGCLTRRSAELATASIWVELDAVTRRRNAMLRDGELYAPFWDIWAAQEADSIARENPRSLAQIVLSGADFSRIR